MALDTDDDLDIFFQDDGIDVSFDGGVTMCRALKEEFDDKVNEGMVKNSSIGRVKAITVRAVDVEGIGMNDRVQINDVSYRIRDVMLIQDGKFKHFLLKE
jgi:hypothetical protein